jgi:hypothetical protein
MLLRAAMESYIEQLRLSAIERHRSDKPFEARAAFQNVFIDFGKNGHHEQSISRSLAASCLSEDVKEPRGTNARFTSHHVTDRLVVVVARVQLGARVGLHVINLPRPHNTTAAVNR